MQTKREVVSAVLRGEKPPYVPWSFWFTAEAAEKLCAHYGIAAGDLDQHVNSHILGLGSQMRAFEQLAGGRVRDRFGVIWDRSQDKDIGVVEGCLLPEPTLTGYQFPDPKDPRLFGPIPGDIQKHPDRFRMFAIDFSLFERAWSLRGMENLLMDFIENPQFVHDLLDAIADHNLELIRHALTYDIDAVYCGDDWGQQHGLIMGYAAWREFIYPRLKRMYAAVRAAGKFQVIHSCGDVDELFDDLAGIGVNLFNPFQPEAMEVRVLLERYRGRLAFWGGLSTQVTLPKKGVADVRVETRDLLERGRAGGYVFSPSHAVEGDVPLANILAFIDEAHRQPGCEGWLQAPAPVHR
jgi:uroporphyrinogen decarboxylase